MTDTLPISASPKRTGPEQAWPEIARLFDHAADLDPDQRQAFLDRQAPDPWIRREVETLLASEPDSDRLLATPAFDTAAQLLLDGDDLSPGRTVGVFEIVRRLGAGGMGTVYLAQRCDDTYRQQVALKVIHAGLASPDLRRLFRQERQILANLNHPAIARLLDGGELPDGRPYLVMELVEGLPIDRYCQSQGLDSDARIRLFLEVCDAVRSAHAQLIVHLDLKPANLLVTPEGRPKVVDFGTARLLGGGRTEAAAPPEEAAFSTPAYASPEQGEGATVTTAADVYSLGVVLLVLLTRRPLPAEDAAPRLGDLPRDLEWILTRALKPRSEDRYPTVGELAQDLRRYLERRPVAAASGSWLWPAWLWVRRHPWAMLAATAALSATLTFMALLRHQRDQATAALERAEQASGFAIDLFEAADPGERLGKPLTAQDMLERGRRLLAEGAFDDPLRLQMTNGLAQRYLKLGDYRAASELLQSARATDRNTDDDSANDSSVEAAEAEALLGRAALREGRWTEAVSHLENALHDLPLGSTRSGSARAHRITARTLTDLVEVRTRQGEYEIAGVLLERTQALSRRTLTARDAELGRLHAIAGYYYFETGQFGLAEQNHRRALELATERGGPRNPGVADALGDLALIYRRRGDGAAALAAAREALEIQRDVFGLDHPAVAVGHHNLGSLYLTGGYFAEAKEMLEVAVARSAEIAAVDPLAPRRGRRFLAYAHHFLGESAEAERWASRSQASPTEALPAEEEARNLRLLGHVLSGAGRWQEADGAFRRALDLATPLPPQNPFRQQLTGDYSRELLRHGRVEEARGLLNALTEDLSPDARRFPVLTLAEVELALAEGHQPEAEELLNRGARFLDADPHHPWHAEWNLSRSEIARAQGDLNTAAEAGRQALAIALERCGDRGPLTVRARQALAAAKVPEAATPRSHDEGKT